MITKINSCGLRGMDGYIISVETSVSGGFPAWEIVGLPDAPVRESKERIRSAMNTAGYVVPGKRIVINLAPADVKKEGACLDLPITVGLLTASEQAFCGNLSKAMFLGELSLDGAVRGVDGVLPMVIKAYQSGMTEVYVPEANAEEAAVVEGVTVYGVKSLKQLADHLTGRARIRPTVIDIKEIFGRASAHPYDFSEVKGQENVKRAMEDTRHSGYDAQRRTHDSDASVPQSAPHGFGGGAVWRRQQPQARRDQPVPQRSAVSGRAARVPQGRA